MSPMRDRRRTCMHLQMPLTRNTIGDQRDLMRSPVTLFTWHNKARPPRVGFSSPYAPLIDSTSSILCSHDIVWGGETHNQQHTLKQGTYHHWLHNVHCCTLFPRLATANMRKDNWRQISAAPNTVTWDDTARNIYTWSIKNY